MFLVLYLLFYFFLFYCTIILEKWTKLWINEWSEIMTSYFTVDQKVSWFSFSRLCIFQKLENTKYDWRRLCRSGYTFHHCNISKLGFTCFDFRWRSTTSRLIHTCTQCAKRIMCLHIKGESTRYSTWPCLRTYRTQWQNDSIILTEISCERVYVMLKPTKIIFFA